MLRCVAKLLANRAVVRSTSNESHQNKLSLTIGKMTFYVPEPEGTGAQINDTQVSSESVYSSAKIGLITTEFEAELALKADSADLPNLPPTTDEHRILLTTSTEGTYEDGLRIYRETNNCLNICDHEESNRSTRDESICIGLSSGCLGNATHQKTVVGYQAARGQSGDQIVCMGVRAFQGSTGQRVTSLGHYSMSQCNNGNDTVAVGNYSGQFSTNLIDSVCVGNDSGRNLTGAGAERCVFIGKEAGKISLGNDNILIGESTGYNNQASFCTGIGRNALLGNAGAACIAIGQNCLGGSFGATANTSANKFCIGDNLFPGSTTKPYILDCDMGLSDSVRVIRLNADYLRLGSALQTAYDPSHPEQVWVHDNTLRLGNFVGGVPGIVETEGYFLKGSNNIWYSDELIEISWDGNDEVFIRHTGLAGIPTDVYAVSHVNTNGVSFPSSNPMIVTTLSNDFLQRSSAFFSDFTIRSDSNATSFPFYKLHFEVTGSSGTTYCYWTVKRYPI